VSTVILNEVKDLVHRRSRILLSLVSLALVISLASCSSSYKTFSVTEGPAAFSFAYPASYDTPMVETAGDPPYTTVSMNRTQPGDTQPDIMIGIDVEAPSEDIPSSHALIELTLLDVEQQFAGATFTVDEREQVAMSGGEGELVSYSVTSEGVVLASGKLFSYETGGIMYSFIMFASHGVGEQAADDFLHLLNSFRPGKPLPY
jgi:hypothetical protein